MRTPLISAWLLIVQVRSLTAQFVNAPSSSDFGVCLGSSAAAKLFLHYAQHSLRQPRLVQMRLESGANPWFEPVAHVESHNRVNMGPMRSSFKNNNIEAEFRNVTLRSASNIYILPLPLFLGKDTAFINIQISRALMKFRVMRDTDYVNLEDCAVDVDNVYIQLDNAPLLNAILNPLHRYLLPRSLIRDSACESVENALIKMRRRFALEIPMISIIPPKFTLYLLSSNMSMFLELEAINAEDDQLTVSASVEWTESATAASMAVAATSSSSEASESQMHSLFDGQGSTTLEIQNLNTDARTTERTTTITQSTSPPNLSDEKLNIAAERLQIWVRDAFVNEFFERFHWNFEWLEEQIPVESPKLPQSTRAFLSALCTNCYFLLRASANGAPNVKVSNSNVLLNKSDQIFMKVVNPTRNVDAVFVNFMLGLSVRLTPIIEAGVFRTQVDLLDTNIRMQEGAFPPGWTSFVQDLVRGMIIDVIWPSLKKEIEFLSYSDGVQIPIYCGLEPNTAQLHFEDGRVGASAALHLDGASLSQCLQSLKSKLPDPSKLLVLRDKRR